MQFKKKNKSRSLKIILSPWAYRTARLILGTVFLYAGFSKIFDPSSFARIISNYGIVPEYLLVPVAILMPAIEIFAALGLIFDIRFSLEVITGFLFLFVGILWFGILKGLTVDCGCFSTEDISEHDSLRHALYRDFIFIALTAYCFIWRKYRGRRVFL